MAHIDSETFWPYFWVYKFKDEFETQGSMQEENG